MLDGFILCISYQSFLGLKPSPRTIIPIGLKFQKIGNLLCDRFDSYSDISSLDY